ncbi:hypothetical protein ILUMI_00484 [Ignelater luminosus]|uniref:DDB1- and CUL4-associated factor 8 n=1 Tax=Ignelater luminosus TaxID=2038154 RepID=A0A8K0GID3_IGNLU|nr:hypothetical protein ILUMI_00484 [Ignelater luminosus]
MDENMSEAEDDVRRSGDPATFILQLMERGDKPKRLKTGEHTVEKAEQSSSSKDSSSSSNTEPETESPSNTEQESAATSTSTSDSGFPRAKNSRSRSYRNSFLEDDSTRSSANDNDNEDPACSEPSRNRSDSEFDMLSETSEMESSSSTVIHDTETESDLEELAVLKKEKPKHNWFMVPELINRQIGYSSKKQSSELFQRRCYGSLHCVQRLELMYKLDKHDGCVNSLNFHPNGSLLASGSDDLKVVIWDWKYGTPLLSFDTKHRGNVFQSKFLPLSGDLHIATCARDGQVRLAQVSVQEGLRSTRKLGCHRGACHKLTILHNQPQVLLSAGEDGVVFSHDVRNSKPDRIITIMSDRREVPLYSISAHPLNSYEFCVSGRDHIVRTYDQRKCGTDTPPLNTYYPKKVQSDDHIGLHVTCALYNHNGSEILASYNDDDIYIFDVNGTPGSFVHQYQGHRNGATIKGVNYFGPKSEFVISGSDCGNIYIWEKNTEAIVNWMLADDSGVVNCLEPHPQLPFLCTSGLDWDIKVWVPSCEKDPLMNGLSETIKTNCKARGNYTSGELSESQMLWILWRHLRSSNRIHRTGVDGSHYFAGFENLHSSSDSSSSSNSDGVDSEADSDDLEGSPGCTTS